MGGRNKLLYIKIPDVIQHQKGPTIGQPFFSFCNLSGQVEAPSHPDQFARRALCRFLQISVVHNAEIRLNQSALSSPGKFERNHRFPLPASPQSRNFPGLQQEMYEAAPGRLCVPIKSVGLKSRMNCRGFAFLKPGACHA